MHAFFRYLFGTLSLTVALSIPGGYPWALEGRAPATPTSSNPVHAMARSAEADPVTTLRVSDRYGRLPLGFERNDGQMDGRVAFLSRGPGFGLFLSANGKALVVFGGARKGALRLTPVGARSDTHPRGEQPLAGTVSYLRGLDRAKWRTGIRTYGRVAYEQIYPGIDLVYYGNHREFEFDFIVHPGADPSMIALAVEGADRLEVDALGDLVFDLGGHQLRQRAPKLYQERHGVRQPVTGRYVLRGTRRVAFQVGPYDPALPLVIDPVLVYSTYIGGDLQMGSSDYAAAIAVDAAGNAYVAGSTDASDFPTTATAFDQGWNGSVDVFVAKLDAAGTSVLYATYLGGSGNDQAYAIAVDALGHACVTGRTQSSDFPTTPGAYDTTLADYSGDAFVTKLDAAGASAVYSTFLGGGGSDRGAGVAIDPAGHAYVAGNTSSGDFPVTAGAFDTSFGGVGDAFVSKLNAAGSTLVYSTLLGGSAEDQARGIAVDALGRAHIAGETSSIDYPTTAGAFDQSQNGLSDAFVTQVDAAGVNLVYSTYLGGSRDDGASGIAIDYLGYPYVSGQTSSTDFPVTAGAFQTVHAGLESDAFVTKLDPAGGGLAYSTYLGGAAERESTFGIDVDASGHAVVLGATKSGDFPLTPGAFDVTFGGPYDVFVVKLSPNGDALSYSTFLVSNSLEPLAEPGLVLGGIAVLESGQACVVGGIDGEFPTTAGAYDPSHNGGLDAFVTRLDATGAALEYSTHLGGHHLDAGGSDRGVAIAVDDEGSAYVTGFTTSFDFPTTVGSYDSSANNDGDVFVTKLDAAGATLIYSTYLGGRGTDKPSSIAVDGNGSAYVAGETNSAAFPTTPGAYDTTPEGVEAFVTKLDPTGSSLIYSTFLGGTSTDTADGLALDSDGSVYVAGATISPDFPTTPGAYDDSPNGSYDVFVTRLDPTGTRLVYSTLLGGSGPDWKVKVGIDLDGNVNVTGRTRSIDFPTTAAGFDRSHNGRYDAFVTKLDAGGASLLYSTYLGGSEDDFAMGVIVDALGQAHVAGETHSADFPTTAGAHDLTSAGETDGFVTKLAASGATLVYSTYLGGGGRDGAAGIVIGQGGQAHVTGTTRSADFPTTPDAFDRSLTLHGDVFVTSVHPDGASLIYSTLLGGIGDDSGNGIAIDAAGALYVAGVTTRPNFPTTPGSFDSHGSYEGVVFKLHDVGPGVPRANITANGADGPITLVPGEPLTIAVAVDAGGRTIAEAEVYVGIGTRSGRLWLDPASWRFVPELRRIYAGPLSSFGPVTVVNLPDVSSLPPDEYWWFIWVDYDADGIPGGGSFDSVVTRVP